VTSGSAVAQSPPGAPHPAGRTLRFLAGLDVSMLKGAGPRRRKALAALGIETVLDLLMHYPFRHHDRTRQAPIAELRPGDEAWVEGVVHDVAVRRTRAGRALVELRVGDHTGSLGVSFFNQPWRERQLPVGTRALWFGRLDVFRGRRRLVNPVVHLGVDDARGLVPVYPASEKAGIESHEIAALVHEALDRARGFVDPLPEALRDRYRLIDRTQAFEGIHRPREREHLAAAKRRLAFDELFRLQLMLVTRRRELEHHAVGIAHPLVAPLDGTSIVERFVQRLGFELTRAQWRAIAEIRADMARPVPMHRLLQGDVGAGKTVVALAAALVAIDGGCQAALMAPTEVLAEQHYLGARELLNGMTVVDSAALGGERPLRVELLTGRVGGKRRARLVAEVAAGAVDLVVGTHALLSEEVRFRSLGLVVVDEQHRFGVNQRAALRARGRTDGAEPDVLVMTATPIPRTAAMVVFGDLDLSVLDELPAGRVRVETRWARCPADEQEAWSRVRSEVAAGRRAYVVCPLVEGSERVAARAVTEERERLAQGPLAGLSLGLLHGRLDPEEKQAAMERFRAGDTPVLVSTTVVEVGVDVPEATVMVVLDAERFGISQLHQLRGRVGRSQLPSWCYLLGQASTPEAARRLEALESTSDGFELAEVDLELRGEGSILGTRQKGRSDLRLATLRRGGARLVAQARRAAEELIGDDLGLERHPLLLDELDLLFGEEARYLFEG
jgi:ATP-dependent DNA helicase RecG